MAKRYYNLEKETKEYLKACEDKSIVTTINTSVVNSYAVVQKVSNRPISGNTLLSRFAIPQGGLAILADPALPDSWNGSVFKDIFSNTLFSKFSTFSIPEYSTEQNSNSFFYKPSTSPLYRNSDIAATIPTLSVQEYSRFAVFKSSSFNSAEINGSGFQPIFGNAYGGNQIDMGLCTGTTGKLTFNQYQNITNGIIQRQATTTLNLGRWYLGGFTHSKSTSTIKIYLNSILDGTFINSNFGNANSDRIIIGGVEATTAPGRFFNGYIGPILHYNKVLTDTEILQLLKVYQNRFPI